MDPRRVTRLVGRTGVGEQGKARGSEGEAAHPGWVRAHLARASWRVRAAGVFISLDRASAPIYSQPGGGGGFCGLSLPCWMFTLDVTVSTVSSQIDQAMHHSQPSTKLYDSSLTKTHWIRSLTTSRNPVCSDGNFSERIGGPATTLVRRETLPNRRRSIFSTTARVFHRSSVFR